MEGKFVIDFQIVTSKVKFNKNRLNLVQKGGFFEQSYTVIWSYKGRKVPIHNNVSVRKRFPQLSQNVFRWLNHDIWTVALFWHKTNQRFETIKHKTIYRIWVLTHTFYNVLISFTNLCMSFCSNFDFFFCRGRKSFQVRWYHD